MKHLFDRIKDLHQLPSDSEKPAQHFLKGAFWGLLFVSLFIMAFAGYYFRTGLPNYLQAIVYIGIGVLAFYLFRWLASAGSVIASYFPVKYLVLILASIGVYLLANEMRLSWPGDVSDLTLGCWITGAILTGGAISALIKKRGSTGFGFLFLFIGIASFVYPIYPLLSSGQDPYPINFDPTSTIDLQASGLSDPGLNGKYDFDYFTYGSGKNKRRPEFGDGVKYETPTVDASLLLPEWTGKRKKWRERFWGFGIDQAPINGRVWLPKKEGKSPLILIVHGNHGMEHYSDPGYQYLGELLASRGFITVSIDENYINGTWSGDFRGREMPARAWLILKHLEQWREWANDPESDFYQKADLDNVMLMGHSRGGEAVSIAAAYNELDYFPDNAQVKFDFNFGIQGIVTIAPTDQRYFRRMELDNINYLSLQGSYDADEASFFGLRQYQRVELDSTQEYFKAGALIHKANHGQFNSIWGRRDFGEPGGWFLNTGPLIKGEEQRKIAKTYIGAFAEAVFNQREDYQPLFQNYASAENWFPETIILNNYTSSSDSVLVDYEEDIDITSTLEGSISAQNFLVWREEALKMRGGETQGTNAVILGWDQDSTKQVADYSILFNSSLSIKSSDDLIFSVGRASDPKFEVSDTLDINFEIQMITDNSDTIQTTLLPYKRLAPKLRVKYMKIDKMNSSFGGNWELAMETISIPLSDHLKKEVRIKGINFRFDKTKKGLIALDNIGYRNKPLFNPD